MKLLLLPPRLISDRNIPWNKRITTPGTYLIELQVKYLFFWLYHSTYLFRAHGKIEALALEKEGFKTRIIEMGRIKNYHWIRYQTPS